jgi:UDP-galactopyranose mutase
LNYPEFAVNYARVVEYKHFLNQKSPHTIIVSETTTSNGEPSKFEIV